MSTVPLVTAYHSALNSFGKVARELHGMLSLSEEHKWMFYEPLLGSFRRCQNIKGILITMKLYKIAEGEYDERCVLEGEYDERGVFRVVSPIVKYVMLCMVMLLFDPKLLT